MTQNKKFNKEAFYINILIAFLFVAMVIIVYQTLESQRESIRVEVENTASELEARIKTGVGSIMSLQATAAEIYKNRDINHSIVKKVQEINAQGDYVLDIPQVGANLTGFGSYTPSHTLTHEMATALALTKYFTIVKTVNSNAVRIYYISKKNFSVSFPYVWSDQFMWNAKMLTHPQWLYATPEVNPTGDLFVTPLHKCQRKDKEKVLLTIGRPLYNGKIFLGTVNMDIDVEHESKFLDSKNLHDGSYVLVNKEGQIVAASGLEGYASKVINQAKQLIPTDILMTELTQNGSISLDDQYVFVKQLEHAPWRLYYFKKKIDIYLNSLTYAVMILIVILLLFRVKTLIKYLAASRDELKRQALTDPMTKLYNRRYLAEITQHMLGLMRRSSSQLAVIMLDIDKFKNVNDTYGHQVGDEVIIKLAEVLQKQIRKSDVACRLGGEEFLLLLPETNSEGAMQVAETLRHEVENLVLSIGEGDELRFTISLGVSQVLLEEENFDAAMNRADEALYEAKEGGRNQVREAQ